MQPARLGALFFCFCPGTLLCTLMLAPPSSCQTVETSQQTNDRLRNLANASSVVSRSRSAPTDYVIGSGDLVSVQVFDVPELSRDLRVSQTGTIGIPLVPVRLHVAGLTEIQAERKIAEVLEANGLVSHPEVSVSVHEKKSKPITVVGAVSHPLVYSADHPVSLIEVLAEAGGIVADAGDQVVITRPVPENVETDTSEPPAIGPEDAAANPHPSQASPGASANANTSAPLQAPSSPRSALAPSGAMQPIAKASDTPTAEPPPVAPPPLSNIITINLNQILETGDMANNIVLQPGDVVTVPHAGIIYVLGAVQRPGGYTISGDRSQLTTLKVLSLAGGLNRTARGQRAVIVRKDGTGKQTEVAVDLKKVMRFQEEDIQLRPSDILYVPNSAGKEAAIKVGELSLGLLTGVLIYRTVI
jgi:polysaccharide biosynthesis/export protein